MFFVIDYHYDFKGCLVQTVRLEHEGIDDNGQLIRCRPASWTVYDDLHRTERSASGYFELDESGDILRTGFVNPVSITIHDVFGHVTDQIRASRNCFDHELRPTDEFEQDSYISWTRSIYHFDKLVATRVYHEIPESGEGVKNVHYAETLYGYDLQGRPVRTVSPLGAISRTVYDRNDNIVQQWLGTNDIGATDDNPHSQEPDNDMRLVRETMYGHTGSCSSCSGTSGDQVLAQIQYSDNGQSRATEYKYDWRGRQTHTLGEEDGNGNYIQTVQYYDNLDRIVKTEQYLCQEQHHGRQTKQRFAPHI